MSIRFRNRITNEEGEALRWNGTNHYQVMKFLEEEDDVCAYTYEKTGLLRLFTLEGSLDLQPMDWILKTTTGVVSCTANIFAQVCEDIT